MNILEFVDLIEAHDYMAENQTSSIRRQLESGSLDMTIEELAQFLLDKQRITKYQAKKLLSEVEAGITADSIPAGPGRQPAADQWDDGAQAEDNLGGLDDFPTSSDPFGEDPMGGDPLGLGGADNFGG